MATRSHALFDAEKLLRGEELVRSGSARLRIDTPPYWWEGELVLTTDRIFFLPHVMHGLLPHTAFWLRDILDAGPAGRNRLHVRTRGDAALFQVLAFSARATAGIAAADWLRALRASTRIARPPQAFIDDEQTRRAAG
jgi:hypothetical protein